MSIKVQALPVPSTDPENLVSHYARECYEARTPEWGKKINTPKTRIFDTGHPLYTTADYHFNIENIPVSACVFGLHATHPFYTTGQRSGRFSKMYDEPNLHAIRDHLEYYYPESDISAAMEMIEYGIDVYQKNIAHLTDLAKNEIRIARPHANDAYIENNSKKFAQEQLRGFISMIAPTGLDHKLSLSAIASLYRTAWSPEMRDIMAQIRDLVLSDYPHLDYIFNAELGTSDWAPQYKLTKDGGGLKYKPELVLNKRASYFDPKKFNDGANIKKDIVDTANYHPSMMDNRTMRLVMDIEIDAGATGGQDQRHRTISRGIPTWTGNFYMPPLLKIGKLENQANKINGAFIILLKQDRQLATAVAPYGAMIKYEKVADINALLHEQAKRTCWCAQEAIYHLGTQLRSEISAKIPHSEMLLAALAPHCYTSGKCAEGVRYCGRDLIDKKRIDWFKNRTI